MEFYNERRGILARYGVEAPLPAAAVLLGRNAVLAEYPSTPRRSRLSLFERAERVGGQDASGWVLYRIAGIAGTDQRASHQRTRHRCPGFVPSWSSEAEGGFGVRVDRFSPG